MKKVVLSCVMMFALLASVSVMAQDSKKTAAPAKVKTEAKATTATKPESKKDSKKAEVKTEKKSNSSMKK
ncbi:MULTISPECIES: hypothetical protein [unclassified Dysgonomonas]|uniref:hypothetical protein n=1 Tax=unclassified Dysgonomonas TaxID=2630389 RepID=UPI000B33E8D7|nr:MULTISPECIES: hypothetical protein [unclassified Dysgonomonas]MBD8348275.1 hypothetical protein [Dysgonomonas sp. HGC4]MBF0575748.1 hypothetical protein [Dysgonomonas sp. GY617]